MDLLRKKINRQGSQGFHHLEGCSVLLYAVLSHFSCVQLFVSPMDCSPPVSVHGILQSSALEWLAMPSSGGSS